jgi:hypothetical protein
MDNIPGVLANTGPYANTVTAGELIYIQQNWDKFGLSVKFYKNEVEVLPPWL